jgi:hypothetical protein
MTHETKPGNAGANGGFERQDLQAKGILYFLLALVLITALCLFALGGVYDFLDRREKASQPPLDPLLTNVNQDTRHVGSEYPKSAFPSPRLETDERGQLNGIILDQERTLNSYGWVDEKAGTVRIPIERAMDLLVARGLAVQPPGGAVNPAADKPATKPSAKKGGKK